MRVSVLACCVVAFAAVPAHGQVGAVGNVEGIVRDTLGRALSQARIVDSDLRWRAISDDSGRYVLRNLPAGRIRLRAIRLGFLQSNQDHTVVAHGTTRLDFRLSHSDFGGEHVWLTCNQPGSLTVTGGRCVPYRRIGWTGLVARAPWTTLINSEAEWLRFLAEHWRDEHRPAPRSVVDWKRRQVVAVSYGQTSGCSNRARYINRAERRGQKLVVLLGPDTLHHGGEICAMATDPIDLVELPRSSRALTFVDASGLITVPTFRRWNPRNR